jgi:hypothetical protein
VSLQPLRPSTITDDHSTSSTAPRLRVLGACVDVLLAGIAYVIAVFVPDDVDSAAGRRSIAPKM